MLKEMSFELLRGMIGILGIGCAHMLARAIVGVRKRRSKSRSFYGWLLRTLLCLAAVAFRHALDVTDVVIWGLALLSFAGGWWAESRERVAEDLTRQIFPGEDDKA